MGVCLVYMYVEVLTELFGTPLLRYLAAVEGVVPLASTAFHGLLTTSGSQLMLAGLGSEILSMTYPDVE